MTPRRPEDFLQDISRKFSQTSPHLPNVISAASSEKIWQSIRDYSSDFESAGNCLVASVLGISGSLPLRMGKALKKSAKL
jgi:hypothetical protein